MPHYLVTVETNYRPMFLIEAAIDEQARQNYADGEESEYWHGEPVVLSVAEVPLGQAQERLEPFGLLNDQRAS